MCGRALAVRGNAKHPRLLAGSPAEGDQESSMNIPDRQFLTGQMIGFLRPWPAP